VNVYVRQRMRLGSNRKDMSQTSPTVDELYLLPNKKDVSTGCSRAELDT